MPVPVHSTGHKSVSVAILGSRAQGLSAFLATARRYSLLLHLVFDSGSIQNAKRKFTIIMIKWRLTQFAQLLVAVTAAFGDINGDNDKKQDKIDAQSDYGATCASNKARVKCIIRPLDVDFKRPVRVCYKAPEGL